MCRWGWNNNFSIKEELTIANQIDHILIETK